MTEIARIFCLAEKFSFSVIAEGNHILPLVPAENCMEKGSHMKYLPSLSIATLPSGLASVLAFSVLSLASFSTKAVCQELEAPPVEYTIPVELQNIPLQASPDELKWFRDAKFGLFIHWGPVSISGKELSWGRDAERPHDIRDGKKPSDIPENYNPDDYISADIYDNLYKQFNPVNFDADEWVQIARDAGMNYIVFTTKHHDGFSNFFTKYSDYSIANTPFHRDIVKELADACHRSGMKLGFYYSPRDWHHPDYLTKDHYRYLEFYHGQIEELCTNYGKVDILWFDSYAGAHDRWMPRLLFRKIRNWQPGIIMNNRGAAVLGGYNRAPRELWGDFDTPEQRIGISQTDRPWESCITLVGNQWS